MSKSITVKAGSITGNTISDAHGYISGNLTIATPPYYGKSRNKKLSEALHLLPVYMIKRCLSEMDNINYYTGSEDLDLALSITEESKELTIKLLKLRGW